MHHHPNHILLHNSNHNNQKLFTVLSNTVRSGGWRARISGEQYCNIRRMERKKKSSSGGGSLFQMPLHYPRYTKKDYLDMPESKLDRLFAEYGLPVQGDLAYKRNYAMGAFLWSHDDVFQVPPHN